MKINWLNNSLRQRIKKIFENLYGRFITDQEVSEIAFSLTGFVENYLKFKWNIRY
ncbi:MAG: hypothetical protein AAB656_04695 [Patescibacteria group bacterium]